MGWDSGLLLWCALVMLGAALILLAAAICQDDFTGEEQGRSDPPEGHKSPPRYTLDDWT